MTTIGGWRLAHCAMPRIPVDIAQDRALQAFAAFHTREGRAPSVRELSKELRFKSPLGAKRTLNNLIDAGLVIAKTRTVRVPSRLSAAGQRRLALTSKQER